MSRVKYVRHGHGWDNCPVMYTIVMNHTEHWNWVVEVFPADHVGAAVSDAIEWDIFSSWFAAKYYMWKKYKEYNVLVNNQGGF